MQDYIVKEEIDGYRKFETIDFSCVTKSEKQKIIQSAKENQESWDEISSKIENEVEALVELKKISYPNIESKFVEKWLQEAKEENEDYYRWQLDYVKQKVQQHESIKRTRKEIDPIKKILIELENIIGNECYNGNIQNYSSWGEMESEGRSFRYPVKFYNGKDEYKKWNISADIPSEELITGYYPFGANELNIYRALHKVLKHLEKSHGLKLPKT